MAVENIILAAVKLKAGNFTSTSQQRLPTGTLRFGSLKFKYATSGKSRDVAEKKEYSNGRDFAEKEVS